MTKDQSKKRPRKRNRSGKKGSGFSVPDTALSYSGPVVPPPFKQERETRIEVMRLDTDVTATAGGVVANVIGSNPASFTNWTQWSATYDEYRVLAMSVHFEPYNRYNSAINQSPCYVVVDRADATALTSYSVALEYSSVMLTNTSERWTKNVKMSGSEDSQWIPVTTGYSALYVKMYAAILTASMAIGRLSTTILVQFRGTK